MDKLSKEHKPLELGDHRDIQALYTNIHNNKLYLSTNIKFKHLGGGWDIIQFLCSWKKANSKASIILNNQVNINKLNFFDEVLLIAFYLADEILFKGNNIKKNLLAKFIPFVKNMNSPTLNGYLENIRAREIKFICLSGAKNEFLQLFYNKDKTFKSKEDVEDLISALLNAPNSKRRKKYLDNIGPIKEIIYEAFSNTDQHGRRNIAQNEMPENIRALTINFISFNNENKKSFLHHQKHYKNFLRDVKDILAISIFDSGEGIVKKYIETVGPKKEKYMDFESRKRVLKKVFLPGMTSSKIPNSGMGLTYIKNCVMDINGLLSLRTNTLELFFSPTHKNKYQEHINEVSPSVGTLITVLIPLSLVEEHNA